MSNDTKTDKGAILIIGATGGIGSVLTRRLAAEGRQLVLAARSKEPLDTLADEVGGKAIVTDATTFDDVQALVKDAGALSGAVNLCGSILLKPAHQTSEADFQETVALNLTSSFALVRAMGPVLRKGGGSIVLMSSAAAAVGLANHEAIAAAKAGVEGLARAAAATYAAQKIRINCVAPGLVDTPLAEGITKNETALKASTAMHPLRRIGNPEDIAAAIHWLLSDESSWMTGQTVGVDGGLARVRSRAG
jgi:NAD(P)-dependent dehydrogenase (short-subunit alcohol dehydrogenase family)